MTPGVIRMVATMTGLAVLSGAFFFVAWRLRVATRRDLASQRAVAHMVGLDTYTPQSQDREWAQWAAHHGGGL